jgi:DNA-3-methyladenine glycosylase
MSSARTLPRRFYARDSLVVAPELLNKVLVRDDPVAGRIAARIVEVEAYRGAEDPGSHGYRGPTPRTASMFGRAGHLYVYFTYGMHWCANVVTGATGEANAVLLRAAEPTAGLDVIRHRRPAARRDRDLTAGPARLAEAFGITGVDDGTDLVRGPIRIVDDGTPPPAQVAWSTRVGLSPGRGDQHPWRCFIPGHPYVSRPASGPDRYVRGSRSGSQR